MPPLTALGRILVVRRFACPTNWWRLAFFVASLSCMRQSSAEVSIVAPFCQRLETMAIGFESSDFAIATQKTFAAHQIYCLNTDE